MFYLISDGKCVKFKKLPITVTIQIVKFSGQPVLSLVLNKKLHQIKKKRNKK